MRDFRLSVLQGNDRLVADHSFFAMRDGRPVGLSPLFLVRDKENGQVKASYGDAPLPWPMVVDAALESELLQDVLLDEVERRCHAGNAGMISLMLSPPGPSAGMTDDFNRIVRKRNFVDVSYDSHALEVTTDSPGAVRERYRRYVRKFSPKYDITILRGADIGAAVAREYMDLHVKDAGGVFRQLPTYERQADLARRGEGFWVVARSKDGALAGMLLIAVTKGSAYDSSVAVDPERADDQISHLLKWAALHHLIEHGVTRYELGPAAITPSYLWQPSAKNYGISFFKSGWSRGGLKRIHAADKFYSRDSLEAYWAARYQDLASHFAVWGQGA